MKFFTTLAILGAASAYRAIPADGIFVYVEDFEKNMEEDFLMKQHREAKM